MKKIVKWEIRDFGVENTQYFKGCGVSGTNYDECFVGVGDKSLKDALKDAAEQMSESCEIPKDLDAKIASSSDTDEVSDVIDEVESGTTDRDILYHAGILVKYVSSMESLQDIVKNHSAKKVQFADGKNVTVDVQTANMLLTIYKAISSAKKDDFEKKLFSTSGMFMKLVDWGWGVVYPKSFTKASTDLNKDFKRLNELAKSQNHKYFVPRLMTSPSGNKHIEITFLPNQEIIMLQTSEEVDNFMSKKAWAAMAANAQDEVSKWAKLLKRSVNLYLDDINQELELQGIDEIDHAAAFDDAFDYAVSDLVEKDKNFAKFIKSKKKILKNEVRYLISSSTLSQQVSQDKIAKKVMELYDIGMEKDWDLGDLDDIIDKYLPSDGDGDLEQQIKSMDKEKAQLMYKEITKIQKDFDNRFDFDDIEVGDYVDFGNYGKLYVTDVDAGTSGRYFWVTDLKEQRFDSDAKGWSILKSLAKKIIRKADE